MPAVLVREARREELPRIVELIQRGGVEGRGNEELGPPLPAAYYEAFDRIQAATDTTLYVADLDGVVVGTFLFSALHNLSNVGRRVAQVESVHVAEEWRGQGIGEQMMRAAIAEARRHGCFRLQLTSDKRRADAHRFYERLGFKKSHEGMKLAL